ncbi:MAG: hypothetical protein ACLPWF_20310 [Bryobacteraceae bacterium]
MKPRLLLSALLLFTIILAPAAFADPALQDWGFNIDGTWYADQTTNTGGLNLSGWNQTTGLGTITLTTTTGGNFDFWVLDPISTPDYNEYGATSGTPGSGQSWQIDVPDYDSIGDTNHPSTSIISNAQADTLNNTNGVPGNASNYFGTCSSGGDCNDITSLAMGFDYGAPASGQEDVITLSLSTTAPTSGFYLEQIHPTDPNNPNAGFLYLSGSITTKPVSVGAVPEPKTSVFLGLAMLALVVCFRRKLVSGQRMN